MSAVLGHVVEGEGPPVALLNGGMMSWSGWEPVAAILRPRFRVLRFDFRGQLLSPGAAPPDLEGHRRDVEALLDALGWESVHLIGTSFGGEVALELAGASPSRARSLVAVTAMDKVTPEFRSASQETRALLADADRPGVRERFWDDLVEGVYSRSYRERAAAFLAARRAQLGRLPASWFAGVARLLEAVEDFDLTPRLAEIRCPCLVVTAADDRVMSAGRSRALAEALGAEVVSHPTSGHALAAEEPEWLARICVEFLDRLEERS